jgi:hypothetical protein
LADRLPSEQAMTVHEFSSEWAPAIQAIAAVLGLISLVLVWWQIRKTNDWNRVSAAFQIMEMEKFFTLEDAATKACKAIEVPFPAELSLADAQKIRSDFSAYHAIKNLATFLERVSVAYQSGYVDRQVLAFTYGALLVGYHRVLQNYIVVTRVENDAPEVYRDFKRTASDAQAVLERCRSRLRDHGSVGDVHGGVPLRF